MKIIISESQFLKLFGGFGKDLLSEAKVPLQNIYQKYYSKIPENEFKEIVSADPTAAPNEMGKYSKWLLKLYISGNLRLEDLYKATEYLTAFTKFNNRIEIKDINRFKSLPELYDVVKEFLDNPNQSTSKSDELRKVKKGEAEVVYNSFEWEIVVPKTWEASKLYGAHTQWCTAARDTDKSFNEYNSQGPLYINIDKRNNKKYQFHFPTESFMYENDSEIQSPIIKEIDMPDEVFNVYKEIQPEHWCDLVYKGSKPLDNGCVYRKGYSNKLKQEVNKLFSSKGDYIMDVYDIIDYNKFYTMAEDINGYYTLIDDEGKIIIGGLDNAVSYGDDEFIVEKEDLYNIVNYKGELYFKEWLEDIERPSVAMLILYKEDGANALLNRKLVFDQWVDDIGNFKDGIAIVDYQGKYTYLNAYTGLITKEWFDNATDFKNGYGLVSKDGMSYWIDTNGNITNSKI